MNVAEALRPYAARVERLLEGAILITACLPLIYGFGFFPYPFVVTKVLFLQIMVSLMMVLYGGLLLIDHKRYWPQIDGVRRMVLLFGGALLVSTVFSVDVHRSLWANHTRMLGTIAFVFYGFLFWIVSGIKSDLFSKHLKWVVLGVSAFSAFLGLLEYVGILFPHRSWQRIGGTVGSPFGLSLVSLYGLVLSFLLLRKRKVVLFLSAALFVAVIYLTGTRGAYMSLVLGSLSAGGLWLTRRPIMRASKKSMRNALVALSALFIGALFGGLAISHVPSFQKLQEIPSVGSRLAAWDFAQQGFAQRPLFGSGPFTFLFTFNEHYDPQRISFSFEETWFDNAHNYFFEQLSTGGIVGLLLYVGIYGAALYGCALMAKRGKADQALAFATLLIMHAVWLMFEFEEPSTLLLWVFVLALIADRSSAQSSQGAPRGAALLVVGLALCGLFGVAIPSVKGSVEHQKALSFAAAGKVGDWFEQEKKALELGGAYEQSIRLDLARVFSEFDIPSDAATNPLVRAVFDSAQHQMGMSQKKHPLDPFGYLFAADIALRRYVLLAEGSADDIMASYDRATSIAPRRPQLYINSAQAAAQLGRVERALGDGQKALSLTPQDARIQKLYADVMILIFEQTQDRQKLQEALRLYQSADIIRPVGSYNPLHVRWAHALLLDGQFERAGELFENLVAVQNSEDACLWSMERTAFAQTYEELSGQIYPFKKDEEPCQKSALSSTP